MKGFFQGGGARAFQIAMESCVFFTILEALREPRQMSLRVKASDFRVESELSGLSERR